LNSKEAGVNRRGVVRGDAIPLNIVPYDQEVIGVMSRSVHNSKGPGYDYGSRYKFNKGYCAGTGKLPKLMARRERRGTSKDIIREELRESYVSSYITVILP